jgi:hypothetical protein
VRSLIPLLKDEPPMISHTSTSDRQAGGRFAPGNAGGPGRPRRAVEVEYLAALNEIVSLEDWKEIVRRAVESAKLGNPKARDWLAKYLVDGIGKPLFQLAVRERQGRSVDDRIDRSVRNASVFED